MRRYAGLVIAYAVVPYCVYSGTLVRHLYVCRNINMPNIRLTSMMSLELRRNYYFSLCHKLKFCCTYRLTAYVSASCVNDSHKRSAQRAREHCVRCAEQIGQSRNQLAETVRTRYRRVYVA